MNVSVVGAGYVGLVSGACLAQLGHSVLCVDIDQEKIQRIREGISPCAEPGLDPLIERLVGIGSLKATADLRSAVHETDVTLIAVGTPNREGTIDLSSIKDVAWDIGEALCQKTAYHVVAVKSTVVPTTTETVVKDLLEEASRKKAGEFGLCVNPEFLREGSAVQDFMEPDRIVIGCLDERSGNTFLPLYSTFDCPVVLTSLRTAEMIKYASNALLATLVSFSNEIAGVCEATGGIDAGDVFKGVHLDRRLALRRNAEWVSASISSYLWHGCGFGGSCLPKDTQALLTFAREHGARSRILQAVLDINADQPRRLVDLCEGELGGVEGRRIAVLGLAFKPDTDDVRDSPALAVIQRLLDRGAAVSVHDPKAMRSAKQGPLSGAALSYAGDCFEALQGAEAAILVTAWPEYCAITPSHLKRLMKQPLVVDGRAFFDRKILEEEGVRWIGIGYREY